MVYSIMFHSSEFISLSIPGKKPESNLLALGMESWPFSVTGNECEKSQ